MVNRKRTSAKSMTECAKKDKRKQKAILDAVRKDRFSDQVATRKPTVTTRVIP
jgi:hypothetical protein